MDAISRGIRCETLRNPAVIDDVYNRGKKLEKAKNKSRRLKNTAAQFHKGTKELNNAFGRKTKSADVKKTDQPENSKIDGKDIFSRKAVLLEKFKHRFIIIACNIRLTFNFYRNQEQRAALKNSRDESKAQLQILNGEKTRDKHFSKAREEMEDGQYVQAADNFVKGGKDVIKVKAVQFKRWLAK
ncbi:hypothetical protein [Endozoicomonas sp. ONNA2]|uniref:hypothetical protein n=1 Tax=Endozoicomonas sp. ONNA2 TaxID=2828741 RepID=UPI002148206E|nr:hypothetical protein [Endozoicomonas sp. ONNA2]